MTQNEEQEIKSKKGLKINNPQIQEIVRSEIQGQIQDKEFLIETIKISNKQSSWKFEPRLSGGCLRAFKDLKEAELNGSRTSRLNCIRFNKPKKIPL